MKKRTKEKIIFYSTYIVILLVITVLNTFGMCCVFFDFFWDSFLDKFIDTNNMLLAGSLFTISVIYIIFINKILLIVLWIISKKFPPKCLLTRFFTILKKNNNITYINNR